MAHAGKIGRLSYHGNKLFYLQRTSYSIGFNGMVIFMDYSHYYYPFLEKPLYNAP